MSLLRRERPVSAEGHPDSSHLSVLPIPLPGVVVMEGLIHGELERLEDAVAGQCVLCLLKHEPGERLSRHLVLENDKNQNSKTCFKPVRVWSQRFCTLC